jgi:Sec-independent protein translocase protein TatA
MFDIAPSELLLVVIVAIVVIGPKDLPSRCAPQGGGLARCAAFPTTSRPVSKP